MPSFNRACTPNRQDSRRPWPGKCSPTNFWPVMLIRSSVAPLVTSDDHYSIPVCVSVSVFVFVHECLEFLRQVMLTDKLVYLINGFIVSTICQPSPSGSSESNMLSESRSRPWPSETCGLYVWVRWLELSWNRDQRSLFANNCEGSSKYGWCAHKRE